MFMTPVMPSWIRSVMSLMKYGPVSASADDINESNAVMMNSILYFPM